MFLPISRLKEGVDKISKRNYEVNINYDVNKDLGSLIDSFEKVWIDELCVETATIPVHIQKIRKKIEKDPANPELIETLTIYFVIV